MFGLKSIQDEPQGRPGRAIVQERSLDSGSSQSTWHEAYDKASLRAPKSLWTSAPYSLVSAVLGALGGLLLPVLPGVGQALVALISLGTVGVVAGRAKSAHGVTRLALMLLIVAFSLGAVAGVASVHRQAVEVQNAEQ